MTQERTDSTSATATSHDAVVTSSTPICRDQLVGCVDNPHFSCCASEQDSFRMTAGHPAPKVLRQWLLCRALEPRRHGFSLPIPVACCGLHAGELLRRPLRGVLRAYDEMTSRQNKAESFPHPRPKTALHHHCRHPHTSTNLMHETHTHAQKLCPSKPLSLAS